PDPDEEHLPLGEGLDLARLGLGSRYDLARRYAERTGRSIAPLPYYQALGLFRLACILEGSWARHVHGAADDPAFAALGAGVPARDPLALPPRDDRLVHLVGPVREAQHAKVAPHARERRVVGDAERAVHLDGPVEHVHADVGGDHLDHRDLLPRLLLADRVHLPGGVQDEEPRLVDLHARRRDHLLYELLLA